MEASPAEFLPDQSKKQHMRNAVQPNLDVRQVATLEDTLLHEDPTKYTTTLPIFNTSPMLQILTMLLKSIW